WPTHAGVDIQPLTGRLAARLDLQALAAATAAAWRWHVQDTLSGKVGDELLWAAMPSEDGMDDVCYHLVGCGRAFVDAIRSDPGPALAIVRNHRQTGLRWVFTSAFTHHDDERYRELLVRRFAPQSVETLENPRYRK